MIQEFEASHKNQCPVSCPWVGLAAQPGEAEPLQGTSVGSTAAAHSDCHTGKEPKVN